MATLKELNAAQKTYEKLSDAFYWAESTVMDLEEMLRTGRGLLSKRVQNKIQSLTTDVRKIRKRYSVESFAAEKEVFRLEDEREAKKGK